MKVLGERDLYEHPMTRHLAKKDRSSALDEVKVKGKHWLKAKWAHFLHHVHPEQYSYSSVKVPGSEPEETRDPFLDAGRQQAQDDVDEDQTDGDIYDGAIHGPCPGDSRLLIGPLPSR